jgi:hypothetical protein
MKMNIFMALFLFSTSLWSQDEDLNVAKNKMNDYMDLKLKYIQDGKECVYKAESVVEVKACKANLMEDFEAIQKRKEEMKNPRPLIGD